MAKAVFLPSPRTPFPQSPILTSTVPSLPQPFLKPLFQNPQRFNLSLNPLFSNFRNGSIGTQCPVPIDQQPINEYKNLSTSFPFSWASADPDAYSSRLFLTGFSFALLVGLPVSWFGSIGTDPDPIKLILGSITSGLVGVTLAVLRMYLGWAYVGNRLLSATVEYEETGWYDGQFLAQMSELLWKAERDGHLADLCAIPYQSEIMECMNAWCRARGHWRAPSPPPSFSPQQSMIWVKSAEVLVRDRLLGSFQVKPVLSRLKTSLVAVAVSLLMCVSLLLNYEDYAKEISKSSSTTDDRVVAGIYNDESARMFEPDAFEGDVGLVAE